MYCVPKPLFYLNRIPGKFVPPHPFTLVKQTKAIIVLVMIMHHPNSLSNIIYHSKSVCLQISFNVDSKCNDMIEFMNLAVP